MTPERFRCLTEQNAVVATVVQTLDSAEVARYSASGLYVWFLSRTSGGQRQ